MAKKEVKISLKEEIRNVGKAIQKVTRAAFEGSPGTASTVKGKSKSAQFTFKLNNSRDKGSIESQARRQILGRIFGDRAAEIESVIKQALEAAVIGIVGAGTANVRVFNRSLGRATPIRNLDQEGFAQFIKTKEGAGEIGLPDPSESMRNLKIALVKSITVDVVVRKSGPQVKFRFDQRRLLALTPHPDRLEGGATGAFHSWLSLVTGPDFARSGTPGFGLVRVSDLRRSLASSKSTKRGGFRSQGRASITENLIRLSRTRGNAGEFAAIMLSTRPSGGGRKATAEAFGGVSEDYRPSARFNGFWDEWWMRNKLELGQWTRKVMRAATKSLLGG